MAFKKAYPKSGTNFISVLKGRQLWWLDTARALWKNSAAAGDYAFDCTDSHSAEEEEWEEPGGNSGSGFGATPSPATPCKRRMREVVDLDVEDLGLSSVQSSHLQSKGAVVICDARIILSEQTYGTVTISQYASGKP